MWLEDAPNDDGIGSSFECSAKLNKARLKKHNEQLTSKNKLIKFQVRQSDSELVVAILP